MTRHILMCEPAHYRIEYEINPWMRRSNAVDRPLAARQWNRLYEALIDLGLQVELVRQWPEVPDMTFAANAGIVCGRRFIPANFRFPERQPERARFIEWFAAAGYEVEEIHEPHYWEGEGDVLPAGGEVFAGYRFRTEFRALDHLDQLLGTKTMRLELVDDRFYHLDTCFCPLGEGRALWYPPAFSEGARRVVGSLFDDLIEAPAEDALRFACNALPVGDSVVMNSGCLATRMALERRGFEVVEAPMDEFIKAGGSVKCLVLTLDSFPDRAGARRALAIGSGVGS
jgi:N-dimethylarginine dimethylaminohydrolase